MGSAATAGDRTTVPDLSKVTLSSQVRHVGPIPTEVSQGLPFPGSPLTEHEYTVSGSPS